MTTQGEEIAHIMVQTFADHLRDGKSLLEVGQHHISAGVSRTVTNTVHLASGVGYDIHQLNLRNEVLVNEGADNPGQKCVGRDGHSDR